VNSVWSQAFASLTTEGDDGDCCENVMIHVRANQVTTPMWVPLSYKSSCLLVSCQVRFRSVMLRWHRTYGQASSDVEPDQAGIKRKSNVSHFDSRD
jgi:hypothetical protein